MKQLNRRPILSHFLIWGFIFMVVGYYNEKKTYTLILRTLYLNSKRDEISNQSKSRDIVKTYSSIRDYQISRL